MRLRFNRQEVTEALSAVCGVTVQRTSKEILKCVRIEAKSDVLLLAATDLELSLRYAVTQVEVDKPGVTVVVADTLAKIVRECEDELLSLETEGNLLHVKGEGSHFQIVTQEADEFPVVQQMEGEPDLAVECAVLRRLVELTAFAAARESTRYAINGVLWEVEGDRLTLAATDGRRLALAHGALVTGGGSSEVIVPGKAMSMVARLPADADARIGLKITDNQLLVDMGRATFSTALVEGRFPKYQDVIPADCDRMVELRTHDFLGALKRASLLTNEESKGVRFAFSKGSLTLASRAPEQGEATIALPISYEGESMEIGFNPIFLLDVLRVVHAETMIFAFSRSDRPGVIRLGDDFVYVVMPVNLTSA